MAEEQNTNVQASFVQKREIEDSDIIIDISRRNTTEIEGNKSLSQQIKDLLKLKVSEKDLLKRNYLKTIDVLCTETVNFELREGRASIINESNFRNSQLNGTKHRFLIRKSFKKIVLVFLLFATVFILVLIGFTVL